VESARQFNVPINLNQITASSDIGPRAFPAWPDMAAQDEAKRVVERWNRELATGRDMWWSPTIRAALVAGTPWLDVIAPAAARSVRSPRLSPISLLYSASGVPSVGSACGALNSLGATCDPQ
jgi:hypothetical protein